MTAVKFFQVNALPAVLQANAFYYVLNGGYAEGYLTDSSAVGKGIGNSAMINALIDARMNTASNLIHVATIAARDTAAASAAGNTMYLVTDATGDATVSSGAALYFFDRVAGTQTKVAEYESLDVTLAWANIQGRPNSTPAAIDSAVGAAHTHANKATLDLLTDVAGRLAYNGTPVGGGEWNTTDW